MVWLAIVTTVATATSSRLNGQQEAPPASIGVQIILDAANEPYRSRVAAAAEASVARYREWLGPGPTRSLTITDHPFRGSAPAGGADVAIDPSWWSKPRAMEVEAHVAFGVARLWFRHLQDVDNAVPLVDSVAWYLQSRVVERLFDHAYRPMYCDETVRFFGGAVPWSFESLPLTRWSAGLGRAEYLDGLGQAAWPESRRRLPAALDRRAVQGALAFGTLERYLGWPALQGALRVVAGRASAGPMDRAAFVNIVSAAVGQDLSWFFGPAFDPSVRLAYAVTEFSSEPGGTSCGASPCYLTRATVARRAEGLFTGSSRAPIGAEEAGDALELRVTYEDHQSVTARWDGRAATRVFAFESPAPAATAVLDPERTLLLDATPLEHARSRAPRTNVPIAKWTARWVMWLQDAMLTYGSLVG